MRLQLALNVTNIDRAVDYYSRLFDTAPHKRRPGYANFAIAEPPLKLVLFETQDATERLNHIGVEITDPTEMAPTRSRLGRAGLISSTEEATTCCHATQDKLWSDEPDGLSWEWYHITDDQPDAASDMSGKTCCV
ncbi:MAG: ArsI/CadI family heavy metal resistance metalloenzyme [Pseudomonadota bacterium]